MRVKTVMILVGALGFGLVAATASRADDAPGLNTYVRLLVGRPDASAAGESILVVPGTVIATGKTAEQQATDVLRVVDELKQAYRLPIVEPSASAMVSLKPGESGKAPSVEGGPEVKLDLLAMDDEKATYRLTLTVRRGGRAIVGSRDGEAAPYLFLMVEPLPYEPPREAEGGPISEPKLSSRVLPKYLAGAKQARLEGIVLLQARVGTDGTVTAIKVLRAEPAGLTEAATEALQQWRYEPARNSAVNALAGLVPCAESGTSTRVRFSPRASW